MDTMSKQYRIQKTKKKCKQDQGMMTLGRGAVKLTGFEYSEDYPPTENNTKNFQITIFVFLSYSFFPLSFSLPLTECCPLLLALPSAQLLLGKPYNITSNNVLSYASFPHFSFLATVLKSVTWPL
jgi:hypothetical protein